MYRTIAKKVFWEFDSIIKQNLSDILPLFCTPKWPSHHVSGNQEYSLASSTWYFTSELIVIAVGEAEETQPTNSLFRIVLGASQLQIM